MAEEENCFIEGAMACYEVHCILIPGNIRCYAGVTHFPSHHAAAIRQWPHCDGNTTLFDGYVLVYNTGPDGERVVGGRCAVVYTGVHAVHVQGRWAIGAVISSRSVGYTGQLVVRLDSHTRRCLPYELRDTHKAKPEGENGHVDKEQPSKENEIRYHSCTEVPLHLFHVNLPQFI